jgi:hypothetical protein
VPLVIPSDVSDLNDAALVMLVDASDGRHSSHGTGAGSLPDGCEDPKSRNEALHTHRLPVKTHRSSAQQSSAGSVWHRCAPG